MWWQVIQMLQGADIKKHRLGRLKIDTSMQNQLVLFIYILAFVTGVPSNMVAFYSFLVKVRQKPSPVGILLLNLTISDLLLLFFLPFKMVEAASGMHWPMPLFLCPIVVFVYFCSIYISSLFLTAVSIDRYLGVAYPMMYKANRKICYTIWVCAFIWIFSGLQGSVSFIVLEYLPSNETNGSSCYREFSKEQLNLLIPFRLEGFIMLFCVPFLITLFCYINFVRILMSMPRIGGRKKYRAVGLAIATMCNFTICFAPYNISHIVGFIQNRNPGWRVYALLLSTLNASLDPIIFYYSSTAVQRTFFKCFNSLKRKLNIVNSTDMQGEQSHFNESRTTYDQESTVVPLKAINNDISVDSNMPVDDDMAIEDYPGI
ncbi:free fatty acid receptor 2-like [Discoglossus pictus]